MRPPVPAPVLDAMRAYLAREFKRAGHETSAVAVLDGTTSDRQVLAAIGEAGWYPGGVAAFVSDHDEHGRRCCPSCGTLASVPYDPVEEEGCCEVCPAVRPLRDHGNEGGEQ